MKLAFTSIATLSILAAMPTPSQATGGPNQNLRHLDVWENPTPQKCSDSKKQSVEVILKTDNYPGETTWWITDDKISDEYKATVLKGYGYTKKLETHTAQLDFCPGCYTYHIKDKYGDGNCCAYGAGKYTIYVDGKKVKEGGKFGKLEEVEFCVAEPMDPVDFYGWDGKKCITKKNNIEGKQGTDYELKSGIKTLRECMAEACTSDKWTGLEYFDDKEECHLWKTVGTFKTQEGAVCFMKTTMPKYM